MYKVQYRCDSHRFTVSSSPVFLGDVKHQFTSVVFYHLALTTVAVVLNPAHGKIWNSLGYSPDIGLYAKMNGKQQPLTFHHILTQVLSYICVPLYL